MPVKPEVIAEFFGYDPEKLESDEAFRELAGKDWTKVSEAAKPGSPVEKAIMGRFNGAARTKAKSLFKELEINADGIDFDKIEALDLFDPIREGAKKAWGSKETELTEKLKGKGSEEAKKEYERQLAEQAKKVTEYETVNSTLRGEIESMKKAEQERTIAARRENSWSQASMTALKDVKFKNALEEKGFHSTARERFQVMYDEKGEEYWAGKDGNRIPDPTKHQAFKSGSQLLKELAQELKVGDANPHGGKPVGQPRTPPTERTAPIRSRPIASPGLAMSDTR